MSIIADMVRATALARFSHSSSRRLHSKLVAARLIQLRMEILADEIRQDFEWIEGR